MMLLVPAPMENRKAVRGAISVICFGLFSMTPAAPEPDAHAARAGAHDDRSQHDQCFEHELDAHVISFRASGCPSGGCALSGEGVVQGRIRGADVLEGSR